VKIMKTPIIIALITISFILASCGPTEPPEPSCPRCPNPGVWTGCNEEGLKTRTNQECGETTNYECHEYTEEKACQTQITLSGTKGMEVVITPTLEEKVKGIIKVELTATPEGTEFVHFFIMPQSVNFGRDMTEEESAQVIRETDMSGADGYKVMFDTTNLENGLYKIFIGPTKEDAPEDSPWTDYAMAQIIVEN
jgi:hypothetical protein